MCEEHPSGGNAAAAARQALQGPSGRASGCCLHTSPLEVSFATPVHSSHTLRLRCFH